MKAQTFLAWCKRMNIKKASELVALTDWSRNRCQLLMNDAEAGKSVQIKKSDDLAMSALAQGLKKWSDYDR